MNAGVDTSKEASSVKHWWMWLALAVAAPGYGSVPQDDLRSAFVKAQASWQAGKPASYEFTIQVMCFCIGISKVPPSFRVVAGQSSPIGGLELASQQFYESYNTVDKIFAAVGRSLSRGQFKSTVQYDDKLGFPMVADLDPSREIFDDELSIRVTNFRVIER